eukprot:m.5620 g.5620  ORF g.5620 m.5620 type:complete len:1042 (+) comp13653_c0_seq1:66-3191(+)
MKKTKNSQEKNIQVVVRCRPLNASEKKQHAPSVVSCVPEKREVCLSHQVLEKETTKTFTFDRVFGPQSEQIDVYKSVMSPILDEVLQGYNCTVFAYGQTGTGKTFTMEGERTEGCVSWEEDPLAGIIPRSLSNLFERLQKQDIEFSVRVSFLELYNEELFDLLAGGEGTSPLRLFEDSARKGSVVIQGLEELPVNTKEEIYKVLLRGAEKRQTAATLLNSQSSRSHSVFGVTVHMKENSLDGEELLKTGKLNLVDLAGSENIGRSGAVDKRAREAGNINQSLLTLGRVITALVDRAPHIPYRESKLTRLLQDSLGGRTKTSIIATISPAACNFEETVSTLDYAHRAKNIKNRPEVNQKLTKRALIKEYTEEIERLKRDLVAARDKTGIYLDAENYKSMQAALKGREGTISEQEGRIKALTAEMEKLSELFTNTSEVLAEKTSKLAETEEWLEIKKRSLGETRKNLCETIEERERQKFLVDSHLKSGRTLYKEAEKLMETVNESQSDVEGLHEKLDRTASVEETNSNASLKFKLDVDSATFAMEKIISEHCEAQAVSLKDLQLMLASTVENTQHSLSGLAEGMHLAVSHNNQAIKKALQNQEKFLSANEEWKGKCEEGICRNQETMVTHLQELTVKTDTAIEGMKALISENVERMQTTFANVQKMVLAHAQMTRSHSEEQLVLCKGVIKRAVQTHVAQMESELEVREKQMSEFWENQKDLQGKMTQEFMKNVGSLFSDVLTSQTEFLKPVFKRTQKHFEDDVKSETELQEVVLNAVDKVEVLSKEHCAASDKQALETQETSKGEVDQIVCSSSSALESLFGLARETRERALSIQSTNDLHLDNQRSALRFNVAEAQCFGSTQAAHFKTTEENGTSSWESLKSCVSQLSSSFESDVSSSKTAAKDLETHAGQFREDCLQKVEVWKNSAITFVDEDLKKVTSTGETPQRRILAYPKELTLLRSNSKLLQSFQLNPGVLPIYEESDVEADGNSVAEASSSSLEVSFDDKKIAKENGEFNPEANKKYPNSKASIKRPLSGITNQVA